jgi:hypothetical protein
MDDAIENTTSIIPFWGVYMMEAKFASDAPCLYGPGLVYFDRFRRLAQVTRKMMAFTKMAKNTLQIERHEKILQIIRAKKVKPVNAWWDLVQPKNE